MNDPQIAQDILVRLHGRNPRYHGNAYLFVLSALQSVSDSLEKRRHISGTELAQGVRRLALEQFGAHGAHGFWSIGAYTPPRIWARFFDLVDCGILLKQDEDSPEDFRGVYDFEDAFERNYPWGRA